MPTTTETFTRLSVWQKSHHLVLAIYQATEQLPSQERFGLISQMRRAATSVPANIAEGTKRRTSNDQRQFLRIAEASLEELKYYLILCRDLGYVTKETAEELIDQSREVGRMLVGLARSLTDN